jgi:glycosyltransferase involved in cell wall biosynthesis
MDHLGPQPVRVEARTTYPLQTASPRVRLSGFQSHLVDFGVSLEVSPTLERDEYESLVSGRSPIRRARILAGAARRLARARHGADRLLLVHRLLFLAALPGLDPPRRLDAYDFDDALFAAVPGVGIPGARFLKREASRWQTYVRRSRLVLAGNDYLAAHALEHARGRVEVLPSCIAPEAYLLRTHRDADPVTVGWVGSPSTSPYLEPVLAAIERVNRSRSGPRVRMIAVGARLRYSAPWLELRAWSEQGQYADLAEFDVGVMPMPDDEWARGKCGYKLLQYFAAGVPAIASPVGVANQMLADGRGLTASSVADWERGIRELAADSRARAERGSACRAFVGERFSYDRWAPELARLLRDLE